MLTSTSVTLFDVVTPILLGAVDAAVELERVRPEGKSSMDDAARGGPRARVDEHSTMWA